MDPELEKALDELVEAKLQYRTAAGNLNESFGQSRPGGVRVVFLKDESK